MADEISHQSQSKSTNLQLANDSSYLALSNNRKESSKNQKPKTPTAISHKFLKQNPRPLLYHICNLLKQITYTDEVFLEKLSILEMIRDLPTIPVGQYFSEGFNVTLGGLLKQTEKSGINTHPLAYYLTRVDILDENGNPDPRLRLVYILGQLIYASAENDPYSSESGFYLAVNAIDSSLWIMFEFNQDNYMGVTKVFGENDRWGEFVFSDPFSAAKIANSISESGIGEINSEISFEPEDTILGGPGKVWIMSPDDEFLHNLLPKDDLDLIR